MNLPRIKAFSYKSADVYFFRFSLIFYVLMALPMIPFIIIYLAMQEGNVTPVMGESMNTVLTLVLAALAFGNVVMGMKFYRKEMAALDSSMPLREKLDLFFHASVIQFSCLEAATVIAVVGLYLTKTIFFVLLFLGMVIIFAQVRPDLRRMTKELRFSKEEEGVIYEKKEIEN